MPQPILILGPLPALEDALADAVSSARRDDPLAPVTVLVGQSLVKRYLPRMLADRGVPQINTRFILPDELPELLAAPDAPKLPRLSRAAERLIARLSPTTPRAYFAEAARSDGFVSAIVRLSRELERGGFAPDRIGEVFTNANIPRAKADHIAAIYADQRHRRTAAGLAGHAEIQAQVEEAAFEGPLIVYGLWNHTATTRDLLGLLLESHPGTVLLPQYEVEEEAHADFRRWLAERGATTRELPPDEQSVAHCVLAGPHSGVTANVELVSVPDVVREVWEAARACLSWARDGIAFHEMAVAYRHRDQHRALAQEIFREAGIPVYLHDGAPLAEHPLGRQLLSLLDLIQDDTFSRQRVMDFLTETDLPRATREQYDGIRAAEWDAYSREAGVVAGIEQWRDRLGRLARARRARSQAENFEWLASQAERVDSLLRFIEDLHAALAAGQAVASWDNHLARVRDLADRYCYGLSPVLEALAELRSLATVAPTVDFELFAQTIREDLGSRDSTRVLGEPVREFGRQGVAVMDASSLRHMRFRTVYLLGLSERSWPAPARPDPLLLEHERAAINNVSGNAQIPVRNAPDEEPLTFRLAIAAAKEHLVASYARAQASRSSRHVPSYFFRSLAETVAGRPLSFRELEGGGIVRRVAAGRMSIDPIERSLTAREYDRGLLHQGMDGGLGHVISALDLGGAALTRRSRLDQPLTAFDGVLSSPDALALSDAIQFGREKPVSPSRLETYATCPYRYFLRYVLRIEPLDEPEALDSIDHLERGSLIHAILERFLRALEGDPPRDEKREQHIALLRKIAEEEAASREARGVTGRPLVWAIEKRQIVEDLLRWYDTEVREGAYTSLVPLGFEVGFGGPAYRFGDESQEEDPLTTENPVVVGEHDVGLRIQGRIDRIDADERRTRFRVIDYKTGKYKKEGPPDRGRALQLPLYLVAASQATNLPVEQGEAQYFYCTRRGEFKRSTFTGADYTARRGDIDLILRTIAQGVDGGYFAPNPGKSADNCRFCDYKFVCNVGIDRIMDRKQQDGPAAAFIALQDIT
jgi:RecB family exonuclease